MSDAVDGRLRLRRGAVEWAGDDRETIGLDLSEAQFVGFNRSATQLWQALAAGTTRDDLVALLVVAYDLPIERARHDVDAFVNACRERGYLE